MNKDIEQINKDIEELIKQDINITSMDLHESAKNLIKKTYNTYIKILNINEVEAHRQNLKNQIKKLQNIKNDNGIDVINQINQIQENLENIKQQQIKQEEFSLFLKELFSFQNKLNNFLNQTVKTVYLYQDKNNNITLYELNSEATYNLKAEFASRGRGITGRFNFSKKFLQDKNNAKEINNKLNFHLEGLQRSYLESIERGDKSKVIRNKKNMIIFWQPVGSDWRKMTVSSKGDLSESYAAYYLINKNSPNFKDNNIENLLDQFLLGDNWKKEEDYYYSLDSRSVQQIKNVSGLLSGDVSKKIDEKNSVEYAIKSQGASMLSYKQIIEMAYCLANMKPENITQAYLEDRKKELESKGVTRNVANNLEVSIENITVEELLESLLKIENT